MEIAFKFMKIIIEWKTRSRKRISQAKSAKDETVSMLFTVTCRYFK